MKANQIPQWIRALEAQGAEALIAQGALVVANHSGGKDSQALLVRLLERVPARQLLVVHATLGDLEWPGALEVAEAQAREAGVPFRVARARRGLLEMVAERHETRPGVPSWPSSKQRYCTSGLKRDPIATLVRGYAKAHGFRVVINALGLRGEESPNRAKAPTWGILARDCSLKRAHFEWLPIHAMRTREVFATIAAAGLKPHWAYAQGNERLSCLFCVFSSRCDLQNAAKQFPEVLARYVALEQRTGYTMHASRVPLAELVGGAST